MGNYRIIINAVGGHGQDRGNKTGESIDFTNGRPENVQPTPEEIILEAVNKLKANGNSVSEATVHHWPGQSSEVVDNLLTGKRIGNF
jgi:hypothetical protein